MGTQGLLTSNISPSLSQGFANILRWPGLMFPSLFAPSPQPPAPVFSPTPADKTPAFSNAGGISDAPASHSRRRFLRLALFGSAALCAQCSGLHQLVSSTKEGKGPRGSLTGSKAGIDVQKPGLQDIPPRGAPQILVGKKSSGGLKRRETSFDPTFPALVGAMAAMDEHGRKALMRRMGKFMRWYREFSIERPYFSGIATSIILGGWMKLAGDFLVRGREDDYTATKWSIFYPASAVYCSAEKVFVYRLFDRAFPMDGDGEAISRNRLGMGIGRTAAMRVYGLAWTWRHLLFMNWVDTGKFPGAFSPRFLKSSFMTWLPGELFFVPTDWAIQTHIPLEFRILASMFTQALPMQAWYTYRQLAMKE